MSGHLAQRSVPRPHALGSHPAEAECGPLKPPAALDLALLATLVSLQLKQTWHLSRIPHTDSKTLASSPAKWTISSRQRLSRAREGQCRASVKKEASGWLVWLNGWSISLCTVGLQVRFPVKGTHLGCRLDPQPWSRHVQEATNLRLSYQCFSPSFSLPLSPKKTLNED